VSHLVTCLAYRPLDGTLCVHLTGLMESSIADGAYRRLEVFYDLQAYAQGVFHPVAIQLNLQRLDDEVLEEVRLARLPHVDYPPAALYGVTMETLLVWAHQKYVEKPAPAAQGWDGRPTWAAGMALPTVPREAVRLPTHCTPEPRVLELL